MFARLIERKRLRELGEIHTLLAVLSTPEIVCFGERFREIERLFLDIPDKNQAHIRNIVGRAEKLGVVKTKKCKYVSRTVELVSLSSTGVRVTNIFEKKGK